ncbi:MAG: TonB-dependent receptor [Bacteroidetes bacterium]|nr:TonB-dependent receptor [Bacteroidota bacterium]
MTKKILPAIPFILVVVFANNMLAQTKDTSQVKTLREVVVTATRTEKDPSDVGRSVTVIGKDEISGSIYNSVAELLSASEGIYITGTGQNPGMNQSIFLRGANSNQVLIMVDGIRVNEASTVNNTIDLSELPLAGIERIEIIRGSHSTLYGSSAIGGVINIITNKKYREGFHSETELKTGAFGKGTSEMGANAVMNYGFKNGIFAGASVDEFHTNGLDATVDTVTDPAVYKHRDRDNWNKFSYKATAGYQNQKLLARFSYHDLKMKTDLDKSAYTDDDNYKLDFTRKNYALFADYHFNSNLSFQLNGSRSVSQRNAVNDSSVIQGGGYDHTFTRSNYSGTCSSAEALFSMKLKSMENVAGFSFSKEEMNQQNYIYSFNYGSLFELNNNLDSVNPHARVAGAFFQTDMNGTLVNENLADVHLLAGVRMNHHELFGRFITYEINPSWHVNEHTVFYSSFSTGFNAPSLYELFTPDRYYTSNLSLGNKKLKPEKSKSFEIGIRQKPDAGVSYSFSVFSSTTENEIEYVYLWDKNIGLDTLGNDWMRDDYRGDKYINIGTQTIHGMEISLHAKLSDQLSFQANVSLIAGKTEYDPSGIDTSETGGNHVQLYSTGAFLTKQVTALGLTRRPSTAAISLQYNTTKHLTASLNARYAGARTDVYYDSHLGPYGALATKEVEDYALLDVNFRYAVTKNLAGLFRIENIFDTRYSEVNGYTTRGRGFYLSLKIII